MRVIYHALGGGHGHVLRGREVLRRLGHGLLVGPARLAPLAGGVAYAAAPDTADVEVVRRWLRDLPVPRLRILDTFPSGPAGELDGVLRASCPLWLVSRLVRRERQGLLEDAGVEQLLWCEEPLAPAPGHRLPPIHEAPVAVERDAARRLLAVEPGRPLLLAVGAGDRERQEALHGLMGRVARRLGAAARMVSDVVPPGRGVVRAWPAAPLLAAADVAVVSGGYHAVLDVRRLGVPAVIVPQDRPWDDQHARARRAVAAWRRVAHDPGGLLAAVGELLGGGGVPEVVGDGAAELAALVERRVQAPVLGQEEVAPLA